MNRAELVEALEVERYTPGPRVPEFKPARRDLPADITPEQAERNLALLIAALDGDVVVVDFLERRAG